MAVRTGTKALAKAIATIDEGAWVQIDYPKGGGPRSPSAPTRAGASSCAAHGLVGPQATLWPDWRHFAFLTDLEGPPPTSTPSIVTTPWSSWPSTI